MPRSGKNGKGKFYGCPSFTDTGCDYSVEFDPPHYAYGVVAEAHDQFGVSQEFQDVPSARYAVVMKAYDAYEDLLKDNFDAVSDFRRIKGLLPVAQKLGFKKKTVDEIREDLLKIHCNGALARE